jgi:phage baseplate assembly protein W
MALPTYRGFSTANYIAGNRKTFLLTNQELVKQDLLNHIYTIRGERVHLPNFGTRIPLLAFEPLDQQTMDIIKEDLTTVVNYDPRVRLIDMAVVAVPDQSMIVAFVDLQYVELGTTETLKLDFGVAG